MRKFEPSGDLSATPLQVASAKLSMGDPTISVPEAGRLLGVGRNASYEAAARGEIPVIRIGRMLRVPKAALMRMLALDHPAGKERQQNNAESGTEAT
jgi:excisionase family DNA binding protein